MKSIKHLSHGQQTFIKEARIFKKAINKKVDNLINDVIENNRKVTYEDWVLIYNLNFLYHGESDRLNRLIKEFKKED